MILIHGENLVQSREKLDQLIQQLPPSSQIIKLVGKRLTLNQLHQHLRSTGLFAEQKTLILFGILSLPQSDLKKKLIQTFKDFPDTSVIFYEEKNVHASTIKSLKLSPVFQFKPDVLVFKFLDNFSPQQSSQALEYLDQLKQSHQSLDMVFALLAMRVRQLIQATSPEKLKTSPWQKQRLVTQAKLFTPSSLISLHQQLYRIDLQHKTGINPPDLYTQLNQLLLSL